MTPDDSLSVSFYLMVAFVALLIGLAKGGLGGTLGVLATPLMTMVLPADQVLGLVLPLLMIADAFAVTLLWKRWNGRLVVLLLPGGVIGVTIGTYLISRAPTSTLQMLLGVIILIFVVYKYFEPRLIGGITYTAKSWHGYLAGTLAGFSSSLAHTGGPPISIYLVLQRLPPLVFNGTAALFFALLNWIKVPYYLYIDLFNWDLLVSVAWSIPLLPLGVWLGKRMAARINPSAFERMIVVLLAISGVLLIAQAWK